MPCLFALIALLTPRILLACIWLFSNYLQKAYQTALWPILGFIFMPVTTLAYAFAIHEHGSVTGGYFVLTLAAALIDLGLVGGGARGGRRRRRHSR